MYKSQKIGLKTTNIYFFNKILTKFKLKKKLNNLTLHYYLITHCQTVF
jgi:hypothetical protein